ncbi:MAG: DUF1266 domain-containing protein [Burkholderiaceae bacterium]|jgi:hypothetical protein|nr:DUF1266 domain-containing protein [Burkholderiaceae bacterium]
MSGGIGAIIFFWLLWHIVKWLSSPWRRRQARLRLLGRARDYRLSEERNFALALAHPMAFHSIPGGFAGKERPVLTQELGRTLRPLTLHYFGFRTDLSDAAARQQLPAAIKTGWFRRDLDTLQPADQPRQAMALACARSAFFVRCAALLGWLDEPLQWQVLQLNAARARDCFDSWPAFVRAYAAGRAQWVAASRGDAVGRAVTEAEITTWLAARWHPWGRWRWPAPADRKGAGFDLIGSANGY